MESDNLPMHQSRQREAVDATTFGVYELARDLLSGALTSSSEAAPARRDKPLQSQEHFHASAGTNVNWSVNLKNTSWSPFSSTEHIDAVLELPGELDTNPQESGQQPAEIYVSINPNGTVTASDGYRGNNWQLTATDDRKSLRWEPIINSLP